MLNLRAAYVFEAKGIQPFIAAGGRLRDAVGASLLIESLCAEADPDPAKGIPTGGLLDGALAASGFAPGEAAFTRRAAGCVSFVVGGPDALARVQRFRALWTLLVQQAAPGLPFVDMIGVGRSVNSAIEAALGRGDARRALPQMVLPQAGPMHHVVPRTGQPAISELAPHESDASERLVDAATFRKRAFAARDVTDRVGLRFWPARPAEWNWPRDLEREFPWRGETQSLGVLHADGNRVGQVLMALGNAAGPGQPESEDAPLSEKERQWLRMFLSFSQALDAATRAAAARACDDVLSPMLNDIAARRDGRKYLPARPILLGGDDVTLLVRGDCAVPFTAAFLSHFEGEAAQAFASDPVLAALNFKPPTALTACAGLAIVGASQPFAQALALAESLCKHAKKVAKGLVSDREAVPSCFSFHRATASLLDSYGDVLTRELTLEGGRQLTRNPYSVGVHAKGLTKYEALAKLKTALGSQEGARGPARELAGMLYAGQALSRQRYGRWRATLSTRAPTVLKDLDEALAQLNVKDAAQLMDDTQSPLGDALALLAAEASA